MRWVLSTLNLVPALTLLNVAWAQPLPRGTEFQINTYSTAGQFNPAVAADADGDYVVVWESYGSVGSDSSSWSIQGQRYNRTGTTEGSQFQVNTYTTNWQFAPAVAPDAAGNFVVVWTSWGSVGSDSFYWSVQGQRYDSTGMARGSQFQVNTYTTHHQGGAFGGPAVAMTAAGNFVVVWESEGSAGSDTFYTSDHGGRFQDRSVQGQRYDSAGAVVGGEFQINTYTTYGQSSPAVAVNATGNFVVVWESHGSVGSDNGNNTWAIQGQRYASSGMAQGSQFQVNTYTTYSQSSPAVAVNATGNFVVVWESGGSAGSDSAYNSVSIQGQRYDSMGTAQSGEFQVNTYTTYNQLAPAVGMDAAGDFVVVWGSLGSAGSDGVGYGGLSVQGQRYDGGGRAHGAEFQVNTYTESVQRDAAMTVDGVGNFVVVWESEGQDGSNYGIFGQRFSLCGTVLCGFDSTAIVYERMGRIYIAASDGSDEDCLTPGCTACSSPVLSSDGNRVAYRSVEDTEEVIRVIDRGLGTDEIVYESDAQAFRFSPEGDRLILAISVPDPRRSPKSAIFELFFGEPEASRTIKTFGRAYAALDPAFSPDGTAILFSRRDRIYVMDADGRGRRRLIRGRGTSDGFSAARMPLLSPDGTQLVFQGSLVESESDLFIADIRKTKRGRYRASNIQSLTSDQSSSLPSWHASGQLIAYQSGNDVSTINPDASQQSPFIASAKSPSFNELGDELAECQCSCECEVPCPDGEQCRNDCLCEPIPLEPPDEAPTACRVICCDGFEVNYDAGSEEACHNAAVDQDHCAGHCRTSIMTYGGNEFWTGECFSCCAWCWNRRDYHEVVPFVCQDCTVAAETYCGSNDRGGLKDAEWGYCGL